MEIAVTGATGFIGKGLVDILLKEGHSVIVLSRNPDRARPLFKNKLEALMWSPENKDELIMALDGIDVIVNLAGNNIGSSLWTKAKREKIIESRVRAGRLVSELICSMKKPPQVLIQASAVGYYGTRGDETLTEDSERGSGFLSEVAMKWENSTVTTETSGVRCVVVRSGVVLSANGGALPKLALPYRLHVGMVLGSGEQWLPWIHYVDEISAIYFLMTNAESKGAYNLVAPFPSRMSEVCQHLGPTLLKLPSSFVKFSLGKMGEETILVSQRVIPRRLLKHGFQFKFENVEKAVADIYGRKDS